MIASNNWRWIILLLALSACIHPKPGNRVLVIIRGDSYCAGIGSSGTSSSSTYYAGKQIQGEQTWGKLLQRRLNENASGTTFTVNIEGYPGQTAEWFANGNDSNNHFQEVKKYISDNLDSYGEIIFSSPYGINESGNIGTGSFSTDTLIAYIAKISGDVLSIDHHIKIIGYPVPRRVDRFSKPSTNGFRNRYNRQILSRPQIIGATSVIDYTKYPQIYSDNAPYTAYFNQSDVDHLTGVHPSDRGYNILAEMYAREIAKITGTKLKSVN